MGKTAIQLTLCFYSLPPYNNVEKQWAELASSYDMGSQHCKGGDGAFETHFLKFPYFVTDCNFNQTLLFSLFLPNLLKDLGTHLHRVSESIFAI